MLGAASCIFLMVYLPPASWWRFVGWLVLGMSVYFIYGYHHSVVGQQAGRPQEATGMQRLAALGFLSLALGLFIIPHDAGPARLFREALDAAQGGHTRSMIGLTLIVVGTLAAAVGALGSSRRRA
jgi:hypothetical protein